MPLVPRHIKAPRRFDAIFVAALSCLMLTCFTVIKLGDTLQTIAPSPPHSFAGLITENPPSIRDKRALGKGASAETDPRHQQASVANASSEESKMMEAAPKSNSEKVVEIPVIESRDATKNLETGKSEVPQHAKDNTGSLMLENAIVSSKAPKVVSRLAENVTTIQQTVSHTGSNVTAVGIAASGSRNETLNVSSVVAAQSATSTANATKVEPIGRVNNNDKPVTKAERIVVSHATGNVSAALSIASGSQVSNKTVAGVERGVSHNKAAIATGGSSVQHYPTYFRDEAPLDKLIRRGNLLRVYSGCSIATWSFSGLTLDDDQRLNDCSHDKGPSALLMHQVTNETASQVQPYDTIYVPIVSLERFVENVLPLIPNDFILMTGQKSLVPPFSRELFYKIIEHPRVVYWFLQNQAVYSYDPHHSKMFIFPYGIFTKYPQEYLQEMARNVTKQNFIYVGYLNKGTNKEVRKDIPRLRHKQFPPLYFAGIRNSTYVLSPDGDRPECHRHYESIGLGAMPITGLDPFLHRHLLGNAYYGEDRWKLQELEEKLPRNPKVNQRLVFEEYWMEYIEREVGRPLRWWDPSRNVRCSLNEIVQDFQKS